MAGQGGAEGPAGQVRQGQRPGRRRGGCEPMGVCQTAHPKHYLPTDIRHALDGGIVEVSLRL